MKYIEETTLFNLHAINYDALVNKIRNSKKNITINLSRLMPFLKLIQEESMIINKVDFPIRFTFNVTAGRYPDVIISFEQDSNLLPHICNKPQNITTIMSLTAFCYHALTPEEMLLSLCNNLSKMKSSEDVSCNKYTAHLLLALEKIDTLLCCDRNLLESVYKHRIYPEASEIICENFNVKVSNKELNVSSKAKRKTGYKTSVFSIDIPITSGRDLLEMRIKFDMYGQELKLTYAEFMSADNKDIEMAIVSILKLKNVNINDIDNLKGELLLHEMMHI